METEQEREYKSRVQESVLRNTSDALSVVYRQQREILGLMQAISGAVLNDSKMKIYVSNASYWQEAGMVEISINTEEGWYDFKGTTTIYVATVLLRGLANIAEIVDKAGIWDKGD